MRLISISTEVVIRNDLSLGLALYYGQLGLNCLWTPIFFEGKRVGFFFART